MFRVRGGCPGAFPGRALHREPPDRAPSSTWPPPWAAPCSSRDRQASGKNRARQDAVRTSRVARSSACSATRGSTEGKALYEWKYAKQLLYTQLLRERIGELIADAPSLPDAVSKIAGQEDAFFSFRFLSAATATCPRSSRRSRRSPRGRDRQGRAGVRGVSARGALRLPGLRPEPARWWPSTSRRSC